MTDSLTAELIEASGRVLDAKLPAPTGFDAQPHLQRWSEIQSHLESLGWFDLLGSCATGGLGLSPALAARLVRLAGSHLVPGPVIETVLTVPWLLTQPGVNAGLLNEVRHSVAIVDPCGDLPNHESLQLRDGRLQGTVRCVLSAGATDALLVHVYDGQSDQLVVVPSTQPGVQVEPLHGSDPCQPVGHLTFDCDLDDVHVIRAPDDALPLKLRAWTRLGDAAYLAGISERVLSFGTDYALTREQFGRRIGGFQAVQHLLADVAVIARSLANLVEFAAAELVTADDHEVVMLGVTAKARASSEAVLACETVLQVFGGIGFTVEHPLHHYLKRALSLAPSHGSPAELYLLAGRLVLAQR